MNKLYRSFNQKDFFFDTIAATVLPQSNYVLLGEEYSSDIIVAAYSTTRSPKIRVGKLSEDGRDLVSQYDTVATENGKGLFRKRATTEGIFNYQGMVDLVDSEGETQSYPFQSEYIVARPSLVVSPTQMNVFYKGIENPVDISVPGVPAENIRATITGGNNLRKVGSNSYVVKMSPSSPNKVYVNVSAKMADGSTRNMGRMEFRAKRLPTPFSTINRKQGSVVMGVNEFKAQLGVSAKYEDDFVFNLNCRVKKFKVFISTAQGEIIFDDWNDGSRFTTLVKGKMSRVKKGYRVTISDIKAIGDDDVQHTLSPIVIKIS